MLSCVKIELEREKRDAVINGVSKVIKSTMPGSLFEKPIVGAREDSPDRLILIYEGVENGSEVALNAMCSGASMANIM